MKRFNLFGKKPVADNLPASLAQPSNDRNFVDDLVNYFSSKQEITAAYFGFGYNTIDKQYQLFLAIDHDIKADSVSQMTWSLKSLHMKDTHIEYASPVQSSDMLEYISQHNPPFYHRDAPALLHQKIMKQWFNVKKYKQELIDTLKESKVYTLANQPEKLSDRIGFATFVKPNGEFVPLFSRQDMISRSGMTEIPMGMAAVEMPFEIILKILGNDQFFVLNPGTPFEVELRA
ncbi:enhanced serine sensitivity protein SseB C-terminal domain-containing protein [Chitinophaga sp. S165]|uniref:SseB family protein n=1 Tax=Chitinophaga sp. S165 TaxID=2135462 RepID=UPI000D9D25A2|nr:enhanced serine sensitivity protein SseB C-terminal domain-containing protein [Chitinophaga sp. S165]PWV56433.1 type III secretion system (T3SS) SseB-like protein [Chitinophaga sp. S165]